MCEDLSGAVVGSLEIYPNHQGNFNGIHDVDCRICQKCK